MGHQRRLSVAKTSDLKTPYADLLPPLSSEEFDSLKQSVKAEGVRVPIDVDENGNVLDGYHRLKIDPNAPRRIIPNSKDWTEAQRKAYAYKANLERRQLSPEQKSEINAGRRETARELSAQGMKQRDIGLSLGAPQRTVSDWLDISDSGPAKANSPKPRDQRVIVPKEEYEVIAERVEGGESQAQVAADYGVTQGRISQVVQAVEAHREQETERAAAIHHENDSLGKKAAPPAVLAIKNSPLILLSPNWYVPGNETVLLQELDEKGAWNIASRLDPKGAFVVFRTMGLDEAVHRAQRLRERWKLNRLGWQINVRGLNRFGKNASEVFVVGMLGNPELPKTLPELDSNDVHCPAAGPEALVLSWFEPFIKARGTENLVIEIGGTEKHKGYQLLTVEDLEAAA